MVGPELGNSSTGTVTTKARRGASNVGAATRGKDTTLGITTPTSILAPTDIPMDIPADTKTKPVNRQKPPIFKGKYQFGDKVILTDRYTKKQIAGVIHSQLEDDRYRVMDAESGRYYYADPSFISPFDPNNAAGLKEPADIYDTELALSKGNIVIGVDSVTGKEEVGQIVSVGKNKDFYTCVTEDGRVLKINRKGAVPFSKELRPKVRPSVMKMEVINYERFKGSNKAKGDKEALQYKKGETPTNDAVINGMKGKYNFDAALLENPVALSEMLGEFNKLMLKLKDTKAVKIDKTFAFDDIRDAQDYYSNLGRTAAGVNITDANGNQTIGLAPKVTQGILEALESAKKGETSMDVKLDEMTYRYSCIGTLVHESIHAWHPPLYNATVDDTKINEGFTEWLARKKTKTFIKAVGLDAQFGHHLDNSYITNDCRAYQIYVDIVDELAYKIEEAGYSAEEILTRVHMTGYGFSKDWKLAARVIGVKAQDIEDTLIEAVRKEQVEIVTKQL